MRLAIIAGEASGDNLGADLIEGYRRRYGDSLVLAGIGGSKMAEAGLQSWFPMSDLSHMGLIAVIANIRLLLRRIKEAKQACIAFDPDILVIIDSPDFTHRVARAVRALNPRTLIINYAPPTVWAWRSGRAKKMRAYIDLCLGLFPFEEKAYRELGGPPLVYVGHPMLAKLSDNYLKGQSEAGRSLGQTPDTILLMPGSRKSFVDSAMGVMLELLNRNQVHLGSSIKLVIPTLPHLESHLQSLLRASPYNYELVTDQDAKEQAMAKARLGLIGFGTASLECGIRGLPILCLQKFNRLERAILSPLIKLKYASLPNIILNRNALSETARKDPDYEALDKELMALWQDGERRQAFVADMDELRAIMLEGIENPAEKAVDAIEDFRQKWLNKKP